MEFLVRLEDKINTQVICTNPAHEDQVVFDDPTFAALCPECNSSEFLYRKNDAVTKKGHFITYKPDGWSWGKNERLYYGIVKIDCTEEQAQEWCKGNTPLTSDSESVKIAVCFRKYKFDFEKALLTKDVKTWTDTKLDSKIAQVPVLSAAVYIKEVADVIDNR